MSDEQTKTEVEQIRSKTAQMKNRAQKRLEGDKRDIFDRSADKARRWTKYQLIIIKAAVSTMIGIILREQYLLLQEDDGYNTVLDWVSPYYLFIAFLVALYFIIDRFEKRHDEHEDTREIKKLAAETSKETSAYGMYFLFESVLPSIDNIDKKIELIQAAPEMIGNISLKAVQRTFAEGANFVGDMSRFVVDEVQKIDKTVRDTIREQMEDIFGRTGDMKKSVRKKPDPNIDQTSLLPREIREKEQDAGGSETGGSETEL